MSNEPQFIHKNPLIVTLIRTLTSELLSIVEKEDEKSQKLIDSAKSIGSKTITINGIMIDLEENENSVRLHGIKNDIMVDDEAREALTRVIHNMTGKYLSQIPIQMIEALSSMRMNNTNILLESIMRDAGVGRAIKMSTGLFAIGYRHAQMNIRRINDRRINNTNNYKADNNVRDKVPNVHQ